MLAMRVQAKQVTVYRADGTGRWYRRRADAYRAAAIAMINARCKARHAGTWADERVCRLLDHDCEHGHLIRKGLYEVEPCMEPTHTYRYRLIGRLARWLRWLEERSQHNEQHSVPENSHLQPENACEEQDLKLHTTGENT